MNALELTPATVSRDDVEQVARSLRELLVPSPPRLGVPPASERLRDVIVEHQLGPLFFSRRNEIRSIPRRLLDSFEADHARGAQSALVRDRAIDEIVGALGGRCALLKGASVSRTLYRNAVERPMSDVDVLVDAPFAEEARLRIAELGYRSSQPRGADHHHLAPLWCPVRRIWVELHTNLATPPLPTCFLVEMWERRTTGERPRLEPVDALIHHALHALADPVDSPLMRNLFEVGWLAHRLSATERRRFVRQVRRLGLANPVGRSLWLARGLFGTPSLLPRPVPSFIEAWCNLRLRWVSSFDASEAGLLRHLALAHLKALAARRAAHDPAPFFRALAGSALDKGRDLLESPAVNGDCRWIHAPGRAAAVGEGRLLLDGRSGDVHLVDALGASAIDRAERAATLGEILQTLASRGATPETSRRTLSRLIEAGLLVPVEA